jgi:Na+:H+ antiporter, NhaA family
VIARPPGTPPAPSRVLDTVLAPLQAFFRLEAASGLLLLGCAVAALAWANLAPESYQAVFSAPLELALGGARLRLTPHAVVNGGLMTLFFALVGMEIKREVVEGELRTFGQAVLPGIGALGGTIVPAAIFLAFNRGGPGAAGWGIPMATDIAFCVGVLTLLRRRVPRALLVFVTALAIFDDIAGIVVIALFYGSGVHGGYLVAALAVAGLAVLLSRARVASGAAWLAVGAALWWALHGAGLHATLAGVVVGFAVPARARAGGDPPLERFERLLHPWMAYGVMPLFALANSGVAIAAIDPARLTGPVAVGTAIALFAGKQAGIFLFTLAAVRLGVSGIPGGASWAKLLGVSMVAGIGFTVALFIAGLAYPDAPHLLDEAKVGILAGSLAAGVAGALVLRATSEISPRPR